MVNIVNINTEYKQSGSICLLASYSIIIEHYSNKQCQLNQVFQNLICYFPDLKKQIKSAQDKEVIEYNRFKNTQNRRPIPNATKTKEETIQNCYHKFCREYRYPDTSLDMRGFDFIVELHNKNNLETKQYCSIIRHKALKDEFIPSAEVSELRSNLQLGGLAMVLYPTKSNLHSIVIGFDKHKNVYFKRDTNFKEIIYEDFLVTNRITEYIWFSNDEKLVENINKK